MRNNLSSHFLKVAMTLACIGFFIDAQAAKMKTKEIVVAQHFDDKELKWGPAPAFLPPGTELAVLHGDPSKKNVDVVMRIPPMATLPLHWHTSAERMILLSGELSVKYEGQESVVLKAGSYAYGPSKLRHEGVCKSSTPCVLFIAFEAPLDAVPVVK